MRLSEMSRTSDAIDGRGPMRVTWKDDGPARGRRRSQDEEHAPA